MFSVSVVGVCRMELLVCNVYIMHAADQDLGACMQACNMAGTEGRPAHCVDACGCVRQRGRAAARAAVALRRWGWLRGARRARRITRRTPGAEHGRADLLRAVTVSARADRDLRTAAHR